MTPNDSARDQDAQDDVTELFDLLDAHFGSKGYRIWTPKDGPSQCQDGVVIMFHKFRVTHSTMALYVNSETLELLGRIKPHRCWPRRAASRLSVQAPWRQALWQERNKASVYIQWFKAGIPRNRTCLCLRHGSTMTRFVRSQPFKLPEGYLQVVASATCRTRLWLHLGFVSGPGHCCRSEEDALRVEEGGRRTQGWKKQE